MDRSILIIGAGVFGLTAALELRRRGWTVTVIDPGPVPRPTAASTDISKVVRLDYGGDELLTALAEAALTGWRLWNRQWGERLFHEDGFLVLTREPMRPGGFEYESFTLLGKRGHKLERIGWNELGTRFPAWTPSGHVDGYFNPQGGWAESGKAVNRLADEARRQGVRLAEGRSFGCLFERGSRVTGAMTMEKEEFRADITLVAAGAWTPTLLPHLEKVMRATGQPVLHFKVERAADWQAPRFPVWAADIGRSGWYGFPALADGTLKVANHGPGRRMHPDEPREVRVEEEERFREFLRGSLPLVAAAPVIYRRLCLYCDTFDGSFWIDHEPDRPGLVVAAGDSGHAFKFAPVLGGIIADVVEKRENRFAARFAWRQPSGSGGESARARK